jgi:hypothetical protein
VEARGLLEGVANQRPRHAMIDDEIEADFGQCDAQFTGTTFQCPRLAREIGPEINDRNGVRGCQSAACASLSTS